MSSGKATQDWQARAEKKRAQCQRLIPGAWKLDPAVTQGLAQPLEKSRNNLIDLDIARRSGILTEKEIQITESHDVAQLLKALASGELSALEVTVAFCKRAAIAQQLVRLPTHLVQPDSRVCSAEADNLIQTSCLTEILFAEAQDRARYLDSLREKGQLAGPLHGLPISLKDSFQIRGSDAVIGFVAYLDNGPAQEDSCLVEVLLKQGAVLYCKTNVPQTLMVR